MTNFERVWNALVSKYATQVNITPKGVHFIHATKGRRFVSARRFAAHGVALCEPT